MNITEEVIIEGHNADPSKTAEIIAEGFRTRSKQLRKNSNHCYRSTPQQSAIAG